MKSSFGVNIIAKCCLLCVVAFALFCTSCGGRRGSTAKGSLESFQSIDLVDTLSVDTIDFGRVRSGEVLVRPLALCNSSQRPVVLITTNTSCGCLELDYPKEPVVAGGAVKAEMTFFSSGYNYFPPRSFLLVTSASMSPKKLVVTATIVQ